MTWQPVTIPPGSGHYTDGRGTGHSVEIVYHEITEELAAGLDAEAGATGWRVIDPGPYASLLVDGEVMMSDTAVERRSCEEAIRDARGDVLIGGLGLGMILPTILAKPEVESVTVLEVNPVIIQLVAPYYQSARLRIVWADAFAWDPGETRYDYTWFDIWPNRSTSNRCQMARLHWRYRRNLKRGGKMRSWVQDELRLLSLWDRGHRDLARSLISQFPTRQKRDISRDFASLRALRAVGSAGK